MRNGGCGIIIIPVEVERYRLAEISYCKYAVVASVFFEDVVVAIVLERGRTFADD